MVKRRVSQLPENVQLRISQFRNLHRDKQCESAIVTTITLIIFFATMGGLDAEGGLLDLDRKFGMGKHRHIFSHSIILGFGVEFAMRFVLLFISAVYSRLPFSHNEIWNRIERIMQKTKKFGVAAVWAGIGVHLFKDSKIFLRGARIKPMVGVPGRHGMMFHKNLLATNSAVAETLGISSVKANK